jgi:hypothetical protein
MHELEVAGERFTISRARRQDVAAIVRLIADDVLGAGRETAGESAYEAAFDEIDADPHQYLAVINAAQGEIVGTFQLTLIPGWHAVAASACRSKPSDSPPRREAAGWAPPCSRGPTTTGDSTAAH